mmetsp:Transcript_27099/g.49389  ORF Transcript_27099/g.49389 Transcript_27099/m.49389 type:complete len:219 (+) Transcript_27099:899-1555(+)
MRVFAGAVVVPILDTGRVDVFPIRHQQKCLDGFGVVICHRPVGKGTVDLFVQRQLLRDWAEGGVEQGNAPFHADMDRGVGPRPIIVDPRLQVVLVLAKGEDPLVVLLGTARIADRIVIVPAFLKVLHLIVDAAETDRGRVKISFFKVDTMREVVAVIRPQLVVNVGSCIHLRRVWDQRDRDEIIGFVVDHGIHKGLCCVLQIVHLTVAPHGAGNIQHQ